MHTFERALPGFIKIINEQFKKKWERESNTQGQCNSL